MELVVRIHDAGEEGGPSLGSEQDSARVARLSLLDFVISLMSGIHTLHGTTTDTPDVDLDTLSIFTGTLEVDGYVQVVWDPCC